MEPALTDVLGGRVPADLSVVYSDVHPLWGGVGVAIYAGGYTRTELERGAAAPVVARGAVPSDAMAELAKLLLEIRVWEQQTPDAPPLPDESRATLVIRCGGAVASVWERVNDMARAGRLVRVRDHLLRVTAPAGG